MLLKTKNSNCGVMILTMLSIYINPFEACLVIEFPSFILIIAIISNIITICIECLLVFGRGE